MNRFLILLMGMGLVVTAVGARGEEAAGPRKIVLIAGKKSHGPEGTACMITTGRRAAQDGAGSFQH